MATAPQPTPPLLTAEEFAKPPDPGSPEELVKGRVVAMPPPGFRHGKVCNLVGRILGTYADEGNLGHVVGNDSGVVTERGPDSVRGADVAFYSYAKIPRDRVPEGYPDVPPDVVFEVISPHDRWPKVLAKVVEYLDAGVAAVAVLDPDRKTLHLYQSDEPVRVLGEADEFALPALLGDFRTAVGRFFA